MVKAIYHSYTRFIPILYLISLTSSARSYQFYEKYSISIGNVYQQRTKTTRILNKIRVVLKIGKLRPFSNSSRSFFLCNSLSLLYFFSLDGLNAAYLCLSSSFFLCLSEFGTINLLSQD
ncbi:hypothetical protein RCL_jg13906.t1 [Rhizophagus clarus]|uniref:Uncharacterized protein n=1 Tax=Rhizophagus clarus TaxID=94130 RepID=A0A8H3LN19_9GLOM|nr:hypothetical protein RCL_jg13906.t1 [Rhizophagus clarus]